MNIEQETRKCTRCDSEAHPKSALSKNRLCAAHTRFARMRQRARADKKYIPSYAELEALLPADMKCSDCERVMCWFGYENRASVMTLQHYRDGTLGLVCMSCNARHAFMPGDTYRDMPKDHKRCCKCKQIKPITNFYRRYPSQPAGNMNIISKCKDCVRVTNLAWQKKNKEYLRQYERTRYHANKHKQS